VIGERLRWLRTRLSRLLRRGKAEAELDAELAFHLDHLVAEHRARGLSERDALLEARRELGDVSSYREEVRDTWRPPELAELWRALRFAARSLARSPGFTALAVAALALGIGANTMMFSAFRTLVLKPLPYPEGERLDRIDRSTAQNPEGRLSPADYLDLVAQGGPYASLTAYALGDVSLAEPGQPPEMVRAMRVTPSFFGTLGVTPELGRDLAPDEDVPGRHRVVLLSRRCWQNRFGGRPDIVGRTVRVDGEPHDVVGVLPSSFNDWRHLGVFDVFRPLPRDAALAADRQSAVLRVIGRRAPGVSPEEAAGFVAHLGARLATDHPDVHAGTTWRRVSLSATVQGQSGPVMLGMCIGLSGFVLLIACSNLANLLLARTVSRSREIALRAALGASRGQLLRPLVAESLLVALAGGACALLVALWGADYLALRSTGDNGEQVVLDFDWPVFGWALGASLVTAVAFGLAPALYSVRLDPHETLKSGARMTGDRSHRRFRHALIVGQFALALILLAGAGSFIRGLDELNHRRAGWDSGALVNAGLVLPAAKYPDAGRIDAFHRLALGRLGALPGVASVSLSSFTPFFNWPDVRRYRVEGQPRPETGREPAAAMNVVTPAYFDTAGTRVVSGRPFDARDTAEAPAVLVINQAMARGLFGDADPLGQRLAALDGGSSGEIVGVAADVKSIVPDPGPVAYQIYRPMAQEPRARAELLVRAAPGVPPSGLVEAIRGAMTELDPDLPLRRLQPAEATLARANYQSGVLRDILIAFAALGLGLASLGVYGVIARTMAQRAGEFAIR
jgi:putative ABC transport system permease protein